MAHSRVQNNHPSNAPITFLLRRAAEVELRVIDVDTGKGVSNVDLWRQEAQDYREVHVTRSWEVATGLSRVDKLCTNTDGVLHALFEPGKHRIGIALQTYPEGYKVVESDGKDIDAKPSEPLHVVFHMRNRKPAETPPTADKPADSSKSKPTNENKDVAVVEKPKAEQQLSFAGQCTDDNGHAIAGAQLSLFIYDGYTDLTERRQSTKTDDAGQFHFAPTVVPPDKQSRTTYLIRAAAQGRASVTNSWDMPIGPHVDQLKFTMPEAASVRGKITGPDGQPVKGAKVWTNMRLRPFEDANFATSNAEGFFEIADLQKDDGKPVPVPGVPGAFSDFGLATLFIQHPGFAQTITSSRIVPGTVNVTLQTAASIEGRVVYGDSDKPAAGVHLFTQSINKTPFLMGGDAVTDSEGRYRFDSLGAGQFNILLWSNKGDYTMAALQSFEATAGTPQQKRPRNYAWSVAD